MSTGQEALGRIQPLLWLSCPKQEETSDKTKLRDFLQITGLLATENGKVTKVNMTVEWIQIKGN